MSSAEPHEPAHRFAVAFGALAAAAPVAWLLLLLTRGDVDHLTPHAAVQGAMFLAYLPLLVLPMAAVVLALRTGWHRTAGLVLLAVGGLLALPSLGLVGSAATAGADADLLLTLGGFLAAVVAGIAALLALRKRAPLELQPPLGGLFDVHGWRALAAGAAAVIAALRVAEAVGAVARGTLEHAPLLLLGGLAGALVWGGVAVAAFRLADGRLLALVLALPGAAALTDAVGQAVQREQLRQLDPAVVTVPPSPVELVLIVALAAAALAAGALWWQHRPLRERPPAVPEPPQPAQR